jgi:hypothetical protein
MMQMTLVQCQWHFDTQQWNFVLVWKTNICGRTLVRAYFSLFWSIYFAYYTHKHWLFSPLIVRNDFRNVDRWCRGQVNNYSFDNGLWSFGLYHNGDSTKYKLWDPQRSWGINDEPKTHIFNWNLPAWISKTMEVLRLNMWDTAPNSPEPFVQDNLKGWKVFDSTPFTPQTTLIWGPPCVLNFSVLIL